MNIGGTACAEGRLVDEESSSGLTFGGSGGGAPGAVLAELEAYIPAFANGGALSRECGGGEVSFGGDGVASILPRVRAGGGGGGTFRWLDVPECCGLIGAVFTVEGGTGGGGGTRLLAVPPLCSKEVASFDFFSSTYALMKLEFLAISSSVMPIANSSSSIPFQDGSTVSIGEGFDVGGVVVVGGGGGGALCSGRADVVVGAGTGGVEVVDDELIGCGGGGGGGGGGGL